MGLLSKLFGKKEVDLDQAVLDQLKSHGSDLSKPHEIDFFLHLPTESDAQLVAQALATEGFQGEVTESEGYLPWTCQVTKAMVPHLADLQKIRQEFRDLTTKHGGEYDGWGTSIVE